MTQMSFGAACLILLLSITNNAAAHIQSDYGNGEGVQPIIEPHPHPEMGTFMNKLFPDDSLIFTNFDKLQWLYEILMLERDIKRSPQETKKSFSVHLLDSYKKFPHPDEISNSLLEDIYKKTTHIVGNIKYVKVFGRRYTYLTQKKSPEEVIISVKVHFKNANQKDIKLMSGKLKAAEKIWNSNRVNTQFQYRFQFDAVTRPEDSHFSVNLVDSSRGPYDTTWARQWNNKSIAHEIGHMMGLGDEYKTLSGEIDCLEKSLMCHSWYGNPQDHHHYFVLRRLVNYKGKTEYPIPGYSPWDNFDE